MGLLAAVSIEGAIYILTIAVIVLAGIVGLAEIFASVVTTVYDFKYIRGKFSKIQSKYTTSEAARIFLDSNDLKEVEIKKCGFWRALLVGQGYSAKHNAIFLRKRVMNNYSLTDVANVMSYIGKAKDYKEGDKKRKRLVRFTGWFGILPYLVVPIILIGVLVDGLLFNFENGGLFTLIMSIVGIVFFIFVAIVMLKMIGVEKKANEFALKAMEESNFLTSDELGKVKSFYTWRILLLVATFIIAVIEIVKLILKVLVSTMKAKK